MGHKNGFSELEITRPNRTYATRIRINQTKGENTAGKERPIKEITNSKNTEKPQNACTLPQK